MSSAISAAGALCWRVVNDRIVVLVVHRTKYGDVTIPKGKVDPGETLPQTAVREILEETGLAITLGVPLGVSAYPLHSGREKIVRYWSAQVSDRAIERSTFVPNSEIAAIEWVSLKKARGYLTYERDVEILDAFEDLVHQGVTSTFALIVLRHGKAEPHTRWDGPDATRPLTDRGVKQSAGDVPTLRAWHPKRIVSSDAVRCVATVAPLAAATGIVPRRDHGISQDAHKEGRGDVRAIVGKRIRARKTAVLCSHGPVLPEILREIALATGTMPGAYLNDAADLDTGGFSVVHLSATNPASGIVSIETYAPPVG
ncbi:DNA mismatch repair protein MutT [Leifsonia xyli subsp. xyli]|uniref:DNA mismatch repair protein MutT n=1 Tax=Leifsonia xyli subsp. xyli TaxID=59736 RepID=A0A1E2SNI6_LEIXY|nr:NUDIX domain-containing protein [Leifsonia xyli]ODA91309.1 DNA mismatch repair protein MutT [Leifsonia xyli subsp. xyli]